MYQKKFILLKNFIIGKKGQCIKLAYITLDGDYFITQAFVTVSPTETRTVKNYSIKAKEFKKLFLPITKAATVLYE